MPNLFRALALVIAHLWDSVPWWFWISLDQAVVGTTIAVPVSAVFFQSTAPGALIGATLGVCMFWLLTAVDEDKAFAVMEFERRHMRDLPTYGVYWTSVVFVAHGIVG